MFVISVKGKKKSSWQKKTITSVPNYKTLLRKFCVPLYKTILLFPTTLMIFLLTYPYLFYIFFFDQQ